MTYGTRLNEALTHAGKSRKDLADVLGCTPQAIGIVITWVGEKDRKLATEAHAVAARFLKVDGYWLATGNGEMVSMSNTDVAPVDSAQAATNNVATLEQSLEGLAHYMACLDESDRAEVMRSIAVLEKEPERHAKQAAGIRATVGTAFVQSARKAA